MSDLHSQFNIIITRAVESSINTYAELISKKFNLNSSEIKNIWYNSENNPHTPIIITRFFDINICYIYVSM